MHSIVAKKIIIFLFILGTLNGFGQNFILTESARVSVITCDTGNESYSLFGHTAIRVTDVKQNLDVVYNYGAFDFLTPNFVIKFAKGDLQYFAVANTFSDFMSQYTYEQRSVFEQELILPLVYKQKIFDDLTAVLASNESYYTYKFIDRNCTSMVVDVLNKTLGANVIRKKIDFNKTYRTILFPYFDNFFYEKLGTSIIFGTKVDQLSNHIFLPFELKYSLQKTIFQNRLLTGKTTILLDYQKQVPFSWWNNVYSYLLILGIILFINMKYNANFYFFVLGILGVFFAIMGFYSYHGELAMNYNILLFNPTLLLLLYFIMLDKRKWIVYSAISNILFLLIYLVIMMNKSHLLIVSPIILLSALTLIKIVLQYNRKKSLNP